MGDLLAQEKSAVIFRRVRGRIVPIRITPEQREALKGGAVAGAGVTLAAGAGAIYKKAVFGSARLAMKAFEAQEKFVSGRRIGQLSFDDLIREQKFQEKITKVAKRAMRMGSLAGAARKGGLFAGSALIGIGGAKIVSAFQKDDDLAAEVGVGTGLALLSFKSKDIAEQSFRAGAHGKKAVGEFLKKSGPFLKNLIKARF